MFEYLRGTLASKTNGHAVIDIGGVGYCADIPASTFARLPECGEEVRLLVHHHVREDVQRLYGFLTAGEREVFRLLLSISQVGPKVALGVLSSVSVNDLADAVAAQEPARLKSVPGIGPKTAQRVVMELKGKLLFPVDGGAVATSTRSAGGGGGVEGEAREAMMSLGYSEAQVARALVRVREVLDRHAPVEEWIRKALQVI